MSGAATLSPAGMALEERLAGIRAKQMAPPPKLTVSEWADRYRVVSSYSAEPGQWRTARTPYLREIMDCFSDRTVNLVVFKKCARIGGTEAGLNIVGYFIDQDPSPILIVQPTVDDAKDFSKEQLAPMLADTPQLAGKVRDPRSKDSGNTVQAKTFQGGGMYLVGANSARGFRRRTARVIDLEEVDGYPPSAGTEGDQIKLTFRRAATFGKRRKIYMNSTPTIAGKDRAGRFLSRIEDYFSRTDQRYYHVPCPSCGHMQRLVWGNLKWDKDQPDTAAYACAGCGAMIAHDEKFAMMAAGRWVPTAPERRDRGYAINALYSPWVTWAELAAEFLEAHDDPGKLQVFVNTALGEPWEQPGEKYDPATITREALPTDAEGYPVVPMGFGVLTAFVDVQDSPGRLEVLVTAWGPGEEAMHLGNWRITGDPVKAAVWEDLERLRNRAWRHASGATLRIRATGVDSGDNTAAVTNYAKPLERRGVFITKGSSQPKAQLLTRPAKRSGKYKAMVWMVGTIAAKDLLFGRLRRVEAPGPGFQRFSTQVDDQFLEQLGAERAIQRNGLRVYERIGGRPNEGIDLLCGTLVALYSLGDVVRRSLGVVADQVASSAPAAEKPAGPDVTTATPDAAPAAEPVPEPPPAPARRTPPPRRGGWAHRW